MSEVEQAVDNTQETVAAEATPEAQTQSPSTETVETPAVPAYTPNYSFKAYDKEHQIDEAFRSIIKDKESEAKVKQIFEKAYGLDDMKPKYQKARQDYEAYKKESDPILSGVNRLTQMLNSGDFDNFFKSVGIPKEALYKYVHSQLLLNDKTPEEKQEYERNVAMRQQHMLLEQQTQSVQEQFEQMSVQNRTFELNSVLDRPDVKAISSAFENAHGPGSFKAAVVDHGFKVWKATGQDLAADQAVNDFSKYLAPFLNSQQAAQNTVSQPNGKPPVIPNISGRSASPVKQVPKSIADLKKLADAFGG